MELSTRCLKTLGDQLAALDLVAIGDQVVRLLVDTFDFPEADARHRVNLWRHQQHQVASQALEANLPGLTPAEREVITR